MAMDKDRKLRLITVNDVYTFESVNGRGGLAAAATVVRDLRRSAPGESLVIMAGDFVGGSAVSVQSRGAVAIDVVNEIGVDAIVLGNHEFDFSWQRLEELIAASTSRFWFGANVRKGDGLLGGCLAHTIVPVAGAKVGFFGVCTQATPSLSEPGDGVVFEDVVAASRECVAELKAQGAETIVAITHVRVALDKEICKACPEIDVVVGGHDHDPMMWYEHDTLLFKGGQNAYWVGCIDLTLPGPAQREGGPEVSWAMHSTAGVEQDAAVLAILRKYTAAHEETQEGLDDVVAELQDGLDTRTAILRTRESSAGKLVADAMRHHAGGLADLACINGGFIRGDKEYAPGTRLLRRDVVQELPFPRVVVCIEISGEHLREAVEQQVRFLPAPSGSFPHFSEGVRIELDAARPAGERVVRFDLDGAPLDPARKYKICLTDFQAGGGDACTSFGFGRHVAEVEQVRVTDVVLSYLASHPKQVGRETRLVVKSEPTT